mmetsp:Transcript_37564/g.125676  ORF Transcript_37564/g.125676 Transcript_37564/m.125676 type:complete len:130 (+) Transcript_37564:334-723(+)
MLPEGLRSAGCAPRPGQEEHAVPLCDGEQLRRVDALRQPNPAEEASQRLGLHSEEARLGAEGGAEGARLGRVPRTRRAGGTRPADSCPGARAEPRYVSASPATTSSCSASSSSQATSETNGATPPPEER